MLFSKASEARTLKGERDTTWVELGDLSEISNVEAGNSFPYEINTVFSYLDRAIELNPEEATFWYFKACWYRDWAEFKAAAKGVNLHSFMDIKQYQSWLAWARDIDTSWDSPRMLLEKSAYLVH